ncbi:MAG TPA: DegV family protein [Candidatus Caccousia avistercoris]|nr:DegV family protein [Candidatus Caccousia avistercoris]
MTAKVKIVADSTCDLNQELLERYQIETIALPVNLGDKACLDGVDVHTPDLFEYYKQTGKLPTTSAPTPAYYEDFYKRWTEEGYEVVHLSISGEMTVTPNIARMAAEKFPQVFPVDSRNVSCGMGMLAIYAAELRDKGLSGAEIAEGVRAQAGKVRTAFVISTLLYMYKGGRCTGVQMLGANLLNLKPCIEVQDGKMGVTKKYRGNLEHVVNQMIADKLTAGEKLDPARLLIAHYDAGDKVVASAKEKIRSLADFNEIHVNGTGCSVSVHCGPGTLGIIYMVQ